MVKYHTVDLQKYEKIFPFFFAGYGLCIETYEYF